MKRKYIVLSSFFIASLLLCLICFASTRLGIGKKEIKKENYAQTGQDKEQKISSETKYIVEVYNEESEELVKEERTVPSEYAGMTRADLEQYLGKYMENIEQNSEEAGLRNIELISFSSKQVVIRKTYYEADSERGFFLKLVDGEVVIFNRAGDKVYEETGISETSVPENERKKLRKGFVVENEKDLYSILENFSS